MYVHVESIDVIYKSHSGNKHCINDVETYSSVPSFDLGATDRHWHRRKRRAGRRPREGGRGSDSRGHGTAWPWPWSIRGVLPRRGAGALGVLALLAAALMGGFYCLYLETRSPA